MSSTVRDKLRQTQFLEGLTDSAIHQLAKVVTAVTYEADAVLFHEGSPRDFMSILVSVAVAIEKGMNGKPVSLVTLGAGQALGEGLLLDELPHGTSARALQIFSNRTAIGSRTPTLVLANASPRTIATASGGAGAWAGWNGMAAGGRRWARTKRNYIR